MKQRFVIFLVLLSCCGFSYSQNLKKIAELKKDLLRKDISDTARISRYINLVREYVNNEKDSALLYADKAEKLSLEKNDIKNHAVAVYEKATVYYYLNDYKSAMTYQL
ncbi:MAG: hypothetical protein ACXVPY_15170, partial [Bacteroidia bacterium]